MQDFLSYLDFVVDMVCLMPPLDKVKDIGLTRDLSILLACGAIGLLALGIIASAMKDAFSGNSAVPVVMAICVAGIGFIGLGQDTIKGIFVTAYPPTVIALRLGEGALVGERASGYLRWWHAILLLSFLIGLYGVFISIPSEALLALKGGWAIIGLLLTSFAWTRMIADNEPFRGSFCTIGVFLVFASTLAYVSTSALERAIYQWALPAGLTVGIIGGRLSRGRGRHAEKDDA